MALNMTNFKTLWDKRHSISKPEQKKRQALYQYDIGAIRRIVRSMINDSIVECPQVISCIQDIPWYAPFTSLNVDAGGNLVFWPDNDVQTLAIDCNTGELSISNGNTIDISCIASLGRYEQNFTNQSLITVTHNLGNHVFVFIVEQTTNTYIAGEITYINPNTIQVDFGSPTSGLIVCRL